jgi:CubicO group peptidase (beta-lactamase class C family)
VRRRNTDRGAPRRGGPRDTVPPRNDAGLAGAAGTVADYARFSQMLLNGGQLDGTRLLSPTTVAFMSADHLGTMKIVSRGGVGTGYGFGLGFAGRKDAGIVGVSGPAGEYRWAASIAARAAVASHAGEHLGIIEPPWFLGSRPSGSAGRRSGEARRRTAR